MATQSRLSRTWRYVRGAAAAAGALGLVNAAAGVYQRYQNYKEYLTLPDEFILEIDVERQQLVDVASASPLQMLLAGGMSRELELRRVLQVLHAAKHDERVKGVVTLLGGRDNFQGLAQMQELRNGVLDFRAHAAKRGAPIIAYSNAFGEGGLNGTGTYMLASGFDAVYMPPCGMLSLLGMESSAVFVKGLLERLKVRAYLWAREEYKNAAATLTNERFEGPHKENVESMMTDTAQQVLGSIALARKLPVEQLESALKEAPLLPQRALELNLVDGIQYRDEVDRRMLSKLKRAAIWLQAERPALEWPHLQSGQQQGKGSKQSVSGSQQAAPSTTAAATTKPEEQQLLKQQAPEQQQQGPAAGTASAVHERVQSVVKELRRRHKGPRVSLQRYWECMQHQQQVMQRQQAWQRWRRGGKDAEGPEAATITSPELGTLATDAGSGVVWGSMAGTTKPIVVVINVSGAILQRSAPGQGLPGQQGVVESHTLLRALRAMRENKQVAAVVVRINSPGGSAVASDVIAQELAQLRAAGKPVIASMGDVAASGGYYIAAPANRILAQPSTITGSIGVISIKPYVTPLMQDYGLNPDTLTYGPNAAWASPYTEPTPEQHALIERSMDAFYRRFLEVVAAGRNMSVERVRAAAKGRVWSGKQAQDLGLVDEMGGLDRAIAVAKQEAGLSPAPTASVVVEWPPRKVPAIMQALKQLGALPTSPDGDEGLQQTSSQLLTALACCWYMMTGSGSAEALMASMLTGQAQLPAAAAPVAAVLAHGLAGANGQLASLQQLQQALLHAQGPQAVSFEAELLSRSC